MHGFAPYASWNSSIMTIVVHTQKKYKNFLIFIKTCMLASVSVQSLKLLVTVENSASV